MPGFWEILLILAVILLVFGPGRIGAVRRGLVKAVQNTFKSEE